MRRQRMFTAAVAACGVVVVLTTFLLLDSGAGAAVACDRARFVDPGSLSLWPPGARCTYGDPPTTDTVINGWFWPLAWGEVAVLAMVVLAVRSPVFRGARR